MSYRLVEPCCGSGALTLHLLGATRALMPYQGSKWRFRHELVRVLEECGFRGTPSQVWLNDIGPWAMVLGEVFHNRDELIEVLEDIAKSDPHRLYQQWQGQTVPASSVFYAAQFLFFQRLAFSGKAVGVKEGRWKSPGFNSSSAYGTPETERFGAVKPMIPGLIRVLKELELNRAVSLRTTQGPAEFPREMVDRPTIVYLDPPYRDSTAYPNGLLSRKEVVDLAIAWRFAGATVLVSEAEPIAELRDRHGWHIRCLSTGRAIRSPFKTRKGEYLTCSP